MPLGTSLCNTILILTVICVLLPSQAQAFGAGDIPDFAYLNDKAFRHGDIENVLSEVVKNVGGIAAGGGLLGFAKQVVQTAAGGAKFSKGDIKKIYFGNWLRDYSQAMDIAGLSKLSADTLVLIVAVLGFMEFGFTTEEFEVTADRLGVYLPTEHIDNPKGYAAKEGDARQYHPKLRPPVNPRELEIDERTGMKKYMATEGQGWDTSTALIRRTLRSCIDYGRRAQGREGNELWEAYRLLGTALHTLEDLLAHSNWCEIALRKMGYGNVFCHVGDATDINTPHGRAPPLVTGTFGGADFLHSLMGEATDKLSQTSVTALSDKMNEASSGSNDTTTALREILGKLPIGGASDKMNEGEQIHAKSQAYHFNPDNICPPDVQRQLLDALKWRDEVFRDIIKKIEMVPGLSDALEELTNALNAYVYTLLAPYLTPILSQVTSVLGEGSKAVIESEDQYEVFDNPRASDPSHSLLSKDHFALILNEPAGRIAKIVVVHTVEAIVQAWSNDDDPDRVSDKVLEAFHHPYYNTGRSGIQNEMFATMQQWLNGLDHEEKQRTIDALTKESVRNHKNKRLDEEGHEIQEGYGDSSRGSTRPQPHGSGYGQKTQHQGTYGHSESSTYDQSTTYGSNDQSAQARYEGRDDKHGSSGGRKDYQSGRREPESYESSYGVTGREEPRGYDSYASSQRDTESHGVSGRHGGYQPSYEKDDSYGSSYGSHQETRQRNEGYQTSYGRSEGHKSYGGRKDDNDHGGRRDDSDHGSYGSGRRDDRDDSDHGSYGSGRRDDSDRSHGSGRRDDSDHDSRRNDDHRRGNFSSRRDSDSHASGHKRDDSDDHGSHHRKGRDKHHERKDREHESYESGGYSAGSGSYDSPPYSGRSESSGGRYSARSEESHESYGSNDDTYGAERLNIDDDQGYRRDQREYDY